MDFRVRPYEEGERQGAKIKRQNVGKKPLQPRRSPSVLERQRGKLYSWWRMRLVTRLVPDISKHIDANLGDNVRSCTHKERGGSHVPDQETKADRKASANENAAVTVANIAHGECAGRQHLIARGNTSLGGVFPTTEGNTSINGNFIRQVSSILKLSPMEPSQKVCVKFTKERLERTTPRDKKQSLNVIQTGSKMRETPNFLPYD